MKIGSIRPQDEFLADTWQRVSYTYLTPADSYTKLLLHFEGTDASTNIKDASGNNKVVNVQATAQLDTAQKKFGSSSMLLDGNSDFVYLADSADWNLSSGDWTIDFWIRPNDVTSTWHGLFFQGTDNSNFVACWLTDVGEIYYKIRVGGSDIVAIQTSGASIGINNWYHIAVVHNGTTYSIYINGISKVTGVDADNAGDYTGNFIIGYAQNETPTSYYFNGWMDEFRLSKGIARWTADFSASLPSAAYTGDNPLTTITISGLDGNTAEEYILRARIINGYNGGAEYDVRLNNDSGNNYGHQYLGATNSTVETSRNTSTNKFYSGYADALNHISMFEQNIYAKSGYIRTAITKQIQSVSGTTCTSLYMFGHSWNNTADNITSIVVIADQANGIGIGSVIELYAKRSKI